VLIVSEPDKKDTKEKSKKNDTAKKGKTYKVEEGDNLSSIAGKYGVSVDDIMEWNNLENDKIIIGQVLIVSNPGKTKETTSVNTKKIIYKVKEGDTLEKIANDYDVTIDNIKEWNSLKSDKIIIGQELKILAKDTKKKK
jgi:LysM repeat protein